MDRALIWRSKAIAHEKRGEKEKADEAYRLGLDDVKFLGRTELESIFQRGAGAVVKQAGLGGENR